MKTTTALYVREDGKILIGEFPDNSTENYCDALMEAIEKAVEVAPEDQNLADAYIKMGMHDRGATWEGVKPGVYPIPGIRYEVREEITPHAMYSKECWSDWLNQDGIGTHQYSTDEGDRYPFIPISRIRLAYITATDGTAPVVEKEEKILVDNWPKGSGEQINWFRVNILRLLSNEQMKSLHEWLGTYQKAEDQHLLWDTALTDAIETESGTIKPYIAMLRYLSEHFTISRK